ncbi:MAG: hypothetical protein ACR2NR_12610 [Solirubrobacteraceae bacterium]
MSRRARLVRYGASTAVTLAGVACGATLSGTLGGTLATALIGLGLVGIVTLIFYEVGLTEDRARAQERRDAESPPPSHDRDRTVAKRTRRTRGLARQRGERRRLR